MGLLYSFLHCLCLCVFTLWLLPLEKMCDVSKPRVINKKKLAVTRDHFIYVGVTFRSEMCECIVMIISIDVTEIQGFQDRPHSSILKSHYRYNYNLKHKREERLHHITVGRYDRHISHFLSCPISVCFFLRRSATRWHDDEKYQRHWHSHLSFLTSKTAHVKWRREKKKASNTRRCIPVTMNESQWVRWRYSEMARASFHGLRFEQKWKFFLLRSSMEDVHLVGGEEKGVSPATKLSNNCTTVYPSAWGIRFR